MKPETQMTVHRIVEYIRQANEFPFDTHDDLQEILDYYKIEGNIRSAEIELLQHEIRTLTEKAQTREIVRQTSEMEGW